LLIVIIIILLVCVSADLLANGGRNRPVGDRPVVGPGYLPSPNGFDVFQGQPAGVVPRGVTPVGGASLQRGPPSPLAPDVSVHCILLSYIHQFTTGAVEGLC